MTTPYDKRLLGDIIGWGGEHVVYEYGQHQVIKFSWHVFFSGKAGVSKLIEDYKVGETYFKDYLLPTRIETWKDGREAIEFQEKIPCRSFTKDDLRDPHLRQQLHGIFACHARMHAETGKMLDLFGFKGLVGLLAHHEISNIKVSGNRLVILDFTIIHIEPRWFEWPLTAFLWWARGRQNRILRKYWEDV